MSDGSTQTKMYSMRLQFFNEILIVAIGNMDTETLKQEAKRAQVELPDLNHGVDIPYYWNPAGELHVIALPENPEVSVIYHEVMHLAFKLMRNKHMSLDSTTGEEMFNYICEEIVWRIRIDILKERKTEYGVFKKL